MYLVIFWRAAHIITTATFAFESLSYSFLRTRKRFTSFGGYGTTTSRAMGKYGQLWFSIFHHISPSVFCMEYTSASKWHQLLFGLFVKYKEKYTPSYYQYNDKPVHPLCISYINQEPKSKRAKYPSDYKPVSFHIVTPYLEAFNKLYRKSGGQLCPDGYDHLPLPGITRFSKRSSRGYCPYSWMVSTMAI